MKNDFKWRMALPCGKKTLLKGITSIYIYIYIYIESRNEVCENKDFCNTIMPTEDTKIFEFNQSQKFDKALEI